MENLKLSDPWYVHRSKLEALFEMDDAVTVGPVENTENGPYVTVKVSNHNKAAALKKVIRPSVAFGNVTLQIMVEDTAEGESEAEILKAAFAYNRIVRGVETVQRDLTATLHTFLVVDPSVLQFWGDNMADYHGNISMLAADVAREVLELTDAQICTADLRAN